MLLRLGCLFVLVPLLELAFLVWIGTRVGLWPTLALVVATGLLGAALARKEGTLALQTVQAEVAQGRVPTRSLLAAAAVLIGGSFLMTPGVLTDLVGFLLLIPGTRRVALRFLQRVMRASISAGGAVTSADRSGGRLTWWTWSGGSGAHGRSGDFPFEFGTRDPAKGRKGEEGDPPPGPGEIIQD